MLAGSDPTISQNTPKYVPSSDPVGSGGVRVSVWGRGGLGFTTLSHLHWWRTMAPPGSFLKKKLQECRVALCALTYSEKGELNPHQRSALGSLYCMMTPLRFCKEDRRLPPRFIRPTLWLEETWLKPVTPDFTQGRARKSRNHSAKQGL